MSDSLFFDIRNRRTGVQPDVFFPDWEPQDESIVVLSPHDDDALLGAGYMMREMIRRHIPLTLVIFCRGDAGYSEGSLRRSIVETRKAETLKAYAELGLREHEIVLMDQPDFSLQRHVAWDGVGHENGLFGDMIRLFRKVHATRLLIANGYREHADHTAVHHIGMFDGVQAGDPILVDFGTPIRLRSVHVYSVWADFSPEDALVDGRSCALRANQGLAVEEDTERIIDDALRCYRSQGEIIEGLVTARKAKKSSKGYIELYQLVDPRPRLPYRPYVEWLDAQ